MPLQAGDIEQIFSVGYDRDGASYVYDGWATWRARFEPLPGTKSLGTVRFYLHNVDKGFTHGCILLLVLLLMGKLIANKVKEVILYFCFLFLSFSLYSQDVKLRNIKAENGIKSKFNFEVSNSTDSIIFYSVALERLDDDMAWHEIIPDVFTYTPSKKTRIFKTAKNSVKKHMFYPSKLLKAPYEDKRCRLRVTYGYTLYNRKMVTYSQSFIFKN